MEAGGLPGNPHFALLQNEPMDAASGQVNATLALAFELRTLTLALSQNTKGWLDQVRGRLGHPTAPPAATPPPVQSYVEPDQRCNKPLMDGRNEIRCWGPKDHEGECT